MRASRSTRDGRQAEDDAPGRCAPSKRRPFSLSRRRLDGGVLVWRRDPGSGRSAATLGRRAARRGAGAGRNLRWLVRNLKRRVGGGGRGYLHKVPAVTPPVADRRTRVVLPAWHEDCVSKVHWAVVHTRTRTCLRICGHQGIDSMSLRSVPTLRLPSQTTARSVRRHISFPRLFSHSLPLQLPTASPPPPRPCWQTSEARAYPTSRRGPRSFEAARRRSVPTPGAETRPRRAIAAGRWAGASGVLRSRYWHPPAAQSGTRQPGHSACPTRRFNLRREREGGPLDPGSGAGTVQTRLKPAPPPRRCHCHPLSLSLRPFASSGRTCETQPWHPRGEKKSSSFPGAF